LNGEPVAQFAHLSAFAEAMLVHENAIVKIREDMPLYRAALIGCGVTTGTGANIAGKRRIIAIDRGGVDYSFEAIGLKVTCEQAWGMLRTGGVATVIGMMPRYVDFYLSGKLKLDPLISTRIPLEKIATGKIGFLDG